LAFDIQVVLRQYVTNLGTPSKCAIAATVH